MKWRNLVLTLLLLLVSAGAGMAQRGNFSPPPESTVTFEDWKLPEEYEQELLFWFVLLACAALFASGLYVARQRRISPEAAMQLLKQLQQERERLAQEISQSERIENTCRERHQQLVELTRLCQRLSSNSTR